MSAPWKDDVDVLELEEVEASGGVYEALLDGWSGVIKASLWAPPRSTRRTNSDKSVVPGTNSD